LLRHRVGLVLVGVLLVANVVALPLAVLSLVEDLISRQESFPLTSSDVPLADPHVLLNLEVLSLDDVNGSITLRASGHRLCVPCDWEERITLFSIPTERTDPAFEGVPPSAAIALPSTAETVTTTLELPVHGAVVQYPFDVHTLLLGVAVQRNHTGGRVEKLSAAEALGHLRLTIRDGAVRVDMATPVAIDPSTVQPTRVPVAYVEVRRISFLRPVYLRIIVPLIVGLIAAAAFYAVALRPFQDLIINSGALVLGVWGVRTLLLGNYPPNVTFVDAALTLVIVLLLFAISLRALLHVYQRAEMALARSGGRPEGRAVSPGDDDGARPSRSS
jgi:hypothetical protein